VTGKLSGRRYVITGAASGIGLATAHVFADEGANVLLVDRAPQESLDSIASERPDLFDALSVDVTAATDLEAMREKAASLFRQIDGIVTSAGIVAFGSMEEIDEALFDRVISINLKGTFFTIKALLPIMKDGATITMVSSMAARLPSPSVSVYGMTKASVTHLTKSLAVELKDRKIRVNSIAPGNIETPIGRNAGFTPGEHDEYFARTANMTPLSRNGQAKEIGLGALYLASDDANFITGTEILVDGGFTLLGG